MARSMAGGVVRNALEYGGVVSIVAIALQSSWIDLRIYFARQGARTEWLQGDHCLCVKTSMLVLAPPMASCRCPRRVLLGLCDHKPREFLAQHQQLQRYPRDLWSYKFKFKFTHPPLPSMIRWTII
jgi:hypothetical protein